MELETGAEQQEKAAVKSLERARDALVVRTQKLQTDQFFATTAKTILFILCHLDNNSML
jgi:hypothetical protein